MLREPLGVQYETPTGFDPSADTSFYVPNPLTNQAGMLAPMTSRYWQSMSQQRSAFQHVNNPIPYGYAERGDAGIPQAVPVAMATLIYTDEGYGGILPMSQQPSINAPFPYGS